MAACNIVTASQTTLLIWPHLLVWKSLAGPAETENVFWQLPNETVTLGYRSLLIGSVHPYYDLVVQQTTLGQPWANIIVSLDCVPHYIMTTASMQKVGGWNDCNLFMNNCESKTTSTLCLFAFLPLSLFLSSLLIFLHHHPPLPPCPPMSYTSRFHITQRFFFLFSPTLVPSHWLCLLCMLIPTRALCIVTTWLMQFLQKAIIVSRRAEPHTR